MRTDEKLSELQLELESIKWDILGISETRMKGETCTVLKNGCTLYQRNSEAGSQGGVAILISHKHRDKITELKSISDRVILAVLKLNRKYSLKIIQVYAPTASSDEREIDEFYDDISKALRVIKTHFTFVMGDYNAKIGKYEKDDGPHIGKYGLGQRNERGEKLLNFLQQHNIYAMNTFFKKPPQRKWTWASPDGSTRNEIDYILCNKKHIVEDVSVINQFSTGSDHRLVRARVRINTKQERLSLINAKNQHLNLTLQNISSYQSDLDRRLTNTHNTPQTSLDDLVQHTTSQIINSVRTTTAKLKITRNPKISPETQQLMIERRKLEKDTLQYREINKTINKAIRKDIRTHNTNMIKESIAQNCNMKVLRKNRARGKNKIYQLKDPEGNLVSTTESMLKIIEQFYEMLYSKQKTIIRQPSRPPVVNVGSEDIPEVDVDEIRKALSQMKTNKTPGEDKCTAEMLKHGGESLLKRIKEIFNRCILEQRIPQLWQNATITLIHKKGDNTKLENYRPISLLSHFYKLFTKVLTNRLTNKFDLYQPPEQAGFRSGYSTIDHLQAIRLLIEKCTEYNLPIYIAFVDYEKAFDSVELHSILEALHNARIDHRYSGIIENIYNTATMSIKLDEITTTKKIKMERGVRQGDTISPKLFTLALEDVFKSIHWEEKGIRVDGKMLNHLRFADDVVLLASSLEELQTMLEQLHHASAKIGLRINLSKTKILSENEEPITINGHNIESVREYIYLGHAIRRGKDNQTTEITRRIKLGWAAFGKLSYIFKSNIPNNLKREAFDKCVLPVMTYGLETTTLTARSADKLRVNQRAMERAMIGISLRDHIRNEDIRRQTKVTDIIERISNSKWSWAGHLARQSEERWAKRLLCWRPRLTKRSIGRPPKRWTDDIQTIAGKNWMKRAQNRSEWKVLKEAYILQWMNNG